MQVNGDVTGSPSPSPSVSEEGESKIWWDERPSLEGSYSTATLVEVAQQMRQLGVTGDDLHAVYAPFIVTGYADFSDTWGSVRHDGVHDLRPHLGQDVFCEEDAPVLAAEDGSVEFVKDRLGGTVVRLHHERGGYWYYAHLSHYPSDLASGDQVSEGDVIGFCGNTGNARGGTPHVHFGSYPGPENPMRDLVDWLEEAEREAKKDLQHLLGGVDVRTMIRLFGDHLVPEPNSRFRGTSPNQILDLILPIDTVLRPVDN